MIWLYDESMPEAKEANNDLPDTNKIEKLGLSTCSPKVMYWDFNKCKSCVRNLFYHFGADEAGIFLKPYCIKD